MMELHARTAFQITGMLYLVMPIFALLILGVRRSKPIRLWCGGEIMIGLGAALLGLRGMMPIEASVFAANMMVYFGALMMVQSLRMELQRPWPSWLIGAIVTGLVTLVALFEILLGEQARMRFVALSHAVNFSIIAWHAWRLGRHWQSPRAGWVTGIYGLLALALSIYLFNLLVAVPGGDPILGNIPTIQAVLPMTILSAIIGNLGYVGMVLDHAHREELAILEANLRYQEQQLLRERLATLDRVRSLGEGATAMSHELNQPLTAMLTNAQVGRRALANRKIDAAGLTELLDKIELNAHRATEILDRIVQRLGAGEIERRPVDLVALTDSVLALMQQDLTRHGVSVIKPETAQALWVSGDRVLLSQVLVNVLRNAIEALQQVVRREIHIDYSVDEGDCRVSISDSGPGLQGEALNSAGTPFFTTKTDGLGMGLAISRTILLQHGGSLHLFPLMSRGACVDLSLPALPT